MQRRYDLGYFVFALGLATLMVIADTQAKIAFVSDRDGHSREIYVMDDDGNNPQRLTNSPEDKWGPSWSPDGKRIVYSSGDGDWEKVDIYVMEVDAGNPQN